MLFSVLRPTRSLPGHTVTFMPCGRDKKVAIMQKYVCSVCGYVYDPEEGDPDNGVGPGTPFENVPDDWVCPICGATKDQFEPE